MDWSLPATGFVVGVLVGLTGIGGGAIMTPFLILVLGTRPVVAVGTDLVYGAITKLAGATIHARQGTVDMRLALRLGAASVPAGILAVIALPDSTHAADEIVRRMLGAVLILVAILMAARLRGSVSVPLSEEWQQRLQGPGTYVVGAVVGALVGFTSVGSGSLLVPFLISVYPMTTARIVGTDVFHAALLVTATAIGYVYADAVDWTLAASLLVGSLPGVLLGSWMAPKVPSRPLRAVLAALLLLTGVKMLWP